MKLINSDYCSINYYKEDYWENLAFDDFINCAQKMIREENA